MASLGRMYYNYDVWVIQSLFVLRMNWQSGFKKRHGEEASPPDGLYATSSNGPRLMWDNNLSYGMQAN